MLWLFREAGKRNPKNVHYQFWRQDNQPKELETNTYMDEKLQYVHNNPVAAGYVSHPEGWIYSSARSYAGEQGLLPIVLLE
jgi:putative transposase